jgi:hypothetical protein
MEEASTAIKVVREEQKESCYVSIPFPVPVFSLCMVLKGWLLRAFFGLLKMVQRGFNNDPSRLLSYTSLKLDEEVSRMGDSALQWEHVSSQLTTSVSCVADEASDSLAASVSTVDEHYHTWPTQARFEHGGHISHIGRDCKPEVPNGNLRAVCPGGCRGRNFNQGSSC